MEKFIQKLTDLLHAGFPGSDVEIEIAVPGQRVRGLLVWNGFQGLEPIERQDRVWDFLEKQLSRDEQLGITTMLTLTPEEMTAARAG
jgi:acid stress-induced BolA-like protein IbaG/YrbA